jgi:hypothetical protein
MESLQSSDIRALKKQKTSSTLALADVTSRKNSCFGVSLFVSCWTYIQRKMGFDTGEELTDSIDYYKVLL